VDVEFADRGLPHMLHCSNRSGPSRPFSQFTTNQQLRVGQADDQGGPSRVSKHSSSANATDEAWTGSFKSLDTLKPSGCATSHSHCRTSGVCLSASKT
jgi:hypothetical protein